MKFAFPILAILISLGAAYFTLTESAKFEQVQELRVVAIKTNKVVAANADAADAKIKPSEDLLKKAKNNLELLNQSVLSMESNKSALKNEVAKIDVKLNTQKEELTNLKEGLKQVQALFDTFGGDVDMNNLAEKIAQIEEGVASKKIKSEEIKTLIKASETGLTAKQEEVQRLLARKDLRNSRISANSMEARVTAVDQEWGFVVIGAGSNSGFTPQTSLLIQRDGRLIGRVKPSAIELTQTIAEIDFELLSPGVRIQPGDLVLLAKPAAN